MDTLADRLEWILAARGMSRRALSLAAGLSQSHVGQIIRGTHKGGVGPDVMKALADAGGVDVVWLMTGEGSPTTDGKPPTQVSPRSARLASRLDTTEADEPDEDNELALVHRLERELGRRVPQDVVDQALATQHSSGLTYDAFRTTVMRLLLDRSGKLPDRSEAENVPDRGGMKRATTKKKPKR